ncbi:MAG: CocE/NonD family hydrolase [Synechococcaceae cyanobacterium]|nr:CocE/NonD family hydrolase [Synechococcaceae cyanobacterium]
MDAADGVRLATRLWRPPQGSGPWPALLMRQPYGRRIASTLVYAHPRWYAAHGFLVVVQDVRGRGESEGDFGGFAQEAADGRCALAWLRRQPECNGRVGTYGFSYQGLSQLLIGVGVGGTEELPDALAPAMCGLDERRHWASEGGAHWWAPLLGWGLQLAAEGCRRRGEHASWEAIRRCLESGAWLREGLDLLRQHDPQGMVAGWLGRDPARARGWTVHEPHAALLLRPMLLIGGWHDPHLNGVLDLWRRSRAAGGRPELLIGAWSHLDWQGGANERQLAFFRRHLQAPAGGQGGQSGRSGEDCGHGPMVVDLQDTLSGSWRRLAAAAPERNGPRRAGRRVWHLHGDGRAAVSSEVGELLSEPAPAAAPGQAWLSLVHDPWRPVPGRGGHLGLEPGLVERADLDRRADVACFTGGPLSEALELLGEPRLVIRVRVQEEGFDLCAALARVSADGSRVSQLCVGMRRARGGGGGGAGGDAHGTTTVRLRLQPLRATLQPGERVRLSLAAAAWPQIGVHPGQGKGFAGPIGPSSAAHRVITLEFALAGARFWLAPLPGLG